MGVNKFIYFAIAPLLLVSASVAWPSGGHKDDNARLAGFLHRKILNEVGRFEKQSESCSAKEKQNEAPDISYEKLKKLGVSRSTAIRSIGYLSKKNYERCISSEKLLLAYDLASFDRLSDKSGLKPSTFKDWGLGYKSIEGLESLIFADKSRIEAQYHFMHLPDKAREYLTGVVGDQPFDALEAVDKNDIAPSHPDAS